MTSILMKIPRELQKQTSWVECACHSGVNQPMRCLKENSAQGKRSWPHKFLYFISQHPDLVPNPLLLSDPCLCRWASYRIACICALSQRDWVSCNELSLGPTIDPIQLLKAPRGDGAVGWQSSGCFRRFLSRIFPGNFPFLWQHLEQMFGWNHILSN